MAFTLSYSVTERNDNKILTITDTSGEVSTGTSTGWGTPNPVYTSIVASGGLHTLELNITISKSDGTETTYDTIDLYTLFAPGGGFADINDLVFPLDCSMLISSGEALGTSDDEFPDGVYEIEYVYDAGLGTEESTTETTLIDGIVDNSITELLRLIPTNYECCAPHEKSTLDTMFCKAYLSSIRKSASVARKDSVLNQLGVLERLVTNVSNYIW